MPRASKQAYFLVDMSDLPKDIRDEVMEDAMAGGATYGVKVVEEVHNGPARQSLFGVYYDVKDASGNFIKRLNEHGVLVEIGNDETKWTAAKKELGITSADIDDADVQSEENDPDGRKEAALRQSAEEAALAEAERVRTAEDAAVAEIVEPVTDAATGEKPLNKANKR